MIVRFRAKGLRPDIVGLVAVDGRLLYVVPNRVSLVANAEHDDEGPVCMVHFGAATAVAVRGEAKAVIEALYPVLERFPGD